MSHDESNNKPQPRVSAIITAYNSAAYIHHAIDSVLNQTYQPMELVIVDDGSHDGTADVIEARYGNRVRVVRQENAGPNGARMRGVRETTGEWIALLDADDTWVLHRLESQIPATSDPDIGLISCYSVNEKPEYKAVGEVTFEMMWERNYVGVPTTLIRRTAFEELGGFDDDRRLVGAEDYNMWLRFAHSRWKVHMVPEELFRYTSAPGSLYSQKERCLAGELLNVEKLGERLNLPQEMIDWKRNQILHAYGCDFLQLRKRHSARKCFWNSLKARPSLHGLKCWLATFVPGPVLDARRQVMLTLRGSPTPAVSQD